MAARIDTFARSLELNERLHALVPGGSHTYSKGEDQFPTRSPRIMARAQGAYCWDVDGNRYVDWGMGNRVIVLGHGHSAVNDAVKRQLDLGLNFTRPGILEYELAEYLVDLWPVAEMVKFGKNGSDVTTAAVKLARAATGRRYVAYCRDHPFFSIHDWFIGTTPMNSGIPEEGYASTLTFPYNDLDGVRELFATHPGQIAALILEPVKNDQPRDGYLEGLRALTEREGTVLIFDEMISGIRFDLRGAHHRYGVYPDLATFGKAIGNGYSISVLAGRRELMELGGLRHDRERVFLLSQTHASETVGLAACRATLEECARVDVTSHIWELGAALVSGVRAIAAEEGVGEHLRMIGFDCNPQLLSTHADGSYWPELHTSFHEEVIGQGVLIPWTSVTLAHDSAELELTLEAVRAGARKIRRALEADAVDASFEGPPVRPVFRSFNGRAPSPRGRDEPALTRLGVPPSVKIGALLRVRLSSSRLPGKALGPIAGRPAIAHLIDRIASTRHIESRRDIVVTTSTDPSDDPLGPVVEAAGASLFRGSLDDVIDRTYQALHAFGFDAVTQVDGDDAFADPRYMEYAMEALLADPSADIVLSRGLPIGMATKAIRGSAIRRVHERYLPGPNGTGAFLYFTDTGLCHVSEIGPVSPAHVHARVRVTLDYPDDLRFFEALVEELGDRPFGTEEIVELVRRKPELVEINAHLTDAYWERSDEFIATERLAFRADDGTVHEIAAAGSGRWYSRPSRAA